MTFDQPCRSAAGTLVSVVLPVFNEDKILEPLTNRIREVMLTRGQSFELIYVNDGSEDDSSSILDALAAHDPRIVVLHLSRNFGHQAAVHAGLEQARGGAVVVMDSDLQDNPQAIPQFLERWEAGFDVVYAERFNRKEAAWKRLLFYGFYRVLNTIADIRIPQDAGNFGLLDRRVVDTLLSLPEFDRYFPGLRSWVGFSQIGVSVERDARYDEKARVSVADLFRLAKTAIFSFSGFPLALFSGIAALSAAVCLISTAFVVWHKLVTGLALPGWASVIITASFFGTLNALGISVLGEYVIRIYNDVRRRPIHLLDRVTNGHSQPNSQQATVPDSLIEQQLLKMTQQIDHTLAMESSLPRHRTGAASQ